MKLRARPPREERGRRWGRRRTVQLVERAVRAAAIAPATGVTRSASGRAAPRQRRARGPRVPPAPAPQPSLSAEFKYVLTTEQTGTFTTPPFEARLAQTVARS